MRTKLIAGNWKMNLSKAESVTLAGEILHKAPKSPKAQILLIPTFVHIDAVAQRLGKSHLMLGAQDVYFEKSGAFTGEVSAEMLLELGVSHVLVGHSERRHVIGEGDAVLNKKLLAATSEKLVGIYCVGETLQERNSGKAAEVILHQLKTGLANLSHDVIAMGHLVIAYEPVWAIGTGQTATPDHAQETHAFIRARLAEILSPELADQIRIQYGGSVKKANAAELLAKPDVDGLLVGGASLIVDEFVGIIQAAEKN
jgi:triosephosphate isomerase